MIVNIELAKPPADSLSEAAERNGPFEMMTTAPDDIISPQENDVLFGRGNFTKLHPGNIALMAMVQKHKPVFHESKHGTKRQVGKLIVNEIHKLGGRFLMEDQKRNSKGAKKVWKIVDTDRAVEKVMRSLWEKEKKKRSSSGKKSYYASGVDKEIDSNGAQKLFPSIIISHDVSRDGATANNIEGGASSAHTSFKQQQKPNQFKPNPQHKKVGDDGQPKNGNGLHQFPIFQQRQVSPPQPAIAQQILSLEGRSPYYLPEEAMVPMKHPTSPDITQLGDDGQQMNGNVLPDGPILKKQASAPHSVVAEQLNTGQHILCAEGRSSFYLLEEAMVPMKHPISVVDFLNSGNLNERMVLASQRDDEGDMSESDARHLEKDQRKLENSARVALLLSRLFVDHLSALDLSLIKMEHFSISLQNVASKITNTGAWVLHRMDLLSPTATADRTQQYSESSAIQTLGKLLYQVFSSGESPPFNLFAESSTPWHAKDADDRSTNQRTTKFRARDESIFSRLSDSIMFPTSICRLISDMTDIGPKSKADSPFVFLSDVIHDLESMVSTPDIYLHGSKAPKVAFGSHFHGRTEETKVLKDVIRTMEQSQGSIEDQRTQGVECVFVSGIGGSGKSRFVQAVSESLSSKWTRFGCKFERGREHASRRILASMFDDQLIARLARTKETGYGPDVVDSQHVTNRILELVGAEGLSSLVGFLPSLPILFDGISKEVNPEMQSEDNEGRLICSLSKIIEAFMDTDEFVIITADDLQWADKSTLFLISQVLVNISTLQRVSCRCLFLGLFRHDEIDENHPFYVQYHYLQMMASNISTTKINLPSLSKDDINDVIAQTLQIPHRIGSELADLVFKKTVGHALFVMELLNSLLRDSVITYSSRECRYTWDECRTCLVETGESVAELISTNLGNMPSETLEKLQTLSCFGIQSDDSLLQMLEGFQKGIISSIDGFVEQGILDRAGPLVIFSHDLIQKAAYDSMPLDNQRSLHLRLGQYLGENIDGSPLAVVSVTKVFGQLGLEDQIFHAGRNMTSTLISIACDQANSAGLEGIPGSMRVKFALWNLSAGQGFASESNFSAALYYYSNGINFLGPDCWLCDHLCLELHQGCVLASFALGEFEHVETYASKVVESVPFEDSLDMLIFLMRALTLSGKHSECIPMGLDAVKRLGLNIPLTPSNESIMSTMAITAIRASQYSSDDLAGLSAQAADDDPVHAAVKIAAAMWVSLYDTSSPFMPLIACEVVQSSFRNGCCQDSGIFFATYGFFTIFLGGDYSGGKHWADMARTIINAKETKTSTDLCEIMLLHTIDSYFYSGSDLASKLITCHQKCINNGQRDLAVSCLLQAWRYRLLGGYNLSLIIKNFDKLDPIAKRSKYSSKYAALDATILEKLTGKPVNDWSSVFGDSISSLEDLVLEAELSEDTRWLNNFHACQLITDFYEGDYLSAEKHFQFVFLDPSFKMPRHITIYTTFFGGLNALRLCQTDCKTLARLKCGKEMMERLEIWSKNVTAVFGNKWMLLQAEYSASMGEQEKAQLLYKSSIDAAKDHGNIHELALAYELIGYHLCATFGQGTQSDECFKKACLYYDQWGATVLCERLRIKHKLASVSDSNVLRTGKLKRSS